MNVCDWIKINTVENSQKEFVVDYNMYLKNEIKGFMSKLEGFDPELLSFNYRDVLVDYFFGGDVNPYIAENVLKVEYDGIDITKMVIYEDSILNYSMSESIISESDFLEKMEQKYNEISDGEYEKYKTEESEKTGSVPEKFLEDNFSSYMMDLLFLPIRLNDGNNHDKLGVIVKY